MRTRHAAAAARLRLLLLLLRLLRLRLLLRRRRLLGNLKVEAGSFECELSLHNESFKTRF
jgi:hypothetical protein